MNDPTVKVIRIPLDLLRHPSIDITKHTAVLHMQATTGGIPIPTPPDVFAAVFAFLLDVKFRTTSNPNTKLNHPAVAERANKLLEELYVFSISRPFQASIDKNRQAEVTQINILTSEVNMLTNEVDTLKAQLASQMEHLAAALPLSAKSGGGGGGGVCQPTPPSPATLEAPPSPPGSILLHRPSPSPPSRLPAQNVRFKS